MEGGVSAEHITIWEVPGSFELPYAASRFISGACCPRPRVRVCVCAQVRERDTDAGGAADRVSWEAHRRNGRRSHLHWVPHQGRDDAL